MTLKYRFAIEHFQQIANTETKSWPDHQWHGDIENCDVCSRPMHSEKFMIDGPASAGVKPMWGNLCVMCAHKHSPKIGWGKAQLYELSPDGVWMLISGGPPFDDQLE